MTEPSIPGVVVRKLSMHSDTRGRFAEVVRASDYPEPFVQSNHSHSAAGVLRGLHFHRRQADLWYVSSGAIRVGLADLRTRVDPPATATLALSADEPTTLYVPAGVAHGYVAIEDADVFYWLTGYYDPTDEHGVAWNDPTLAIPWGIDEPVLSERDSLNPELRWDDIPPFS